MRMRVLRAPKRITSHVRLKNVNVSVSASGGEILTRVRNRREVWLSTNRIAGKISSHVIVVPGCIPGFPVVSIRGRHCCSMVVVVLLWSY